MKDFFEYLDHTINPKHKCNMNHFQKAQQKGKEEFDNKFSWLRNYEGNGTDPRGLLKSFLDSYAQDIRLAVIEDVRERALIKVRKTDFGNENSEDIKHNEAIMDFLAKLPSER